MKNILNPNDKHVHNVNIHISDGTVTRCRTTSNTLSLESISQSLTPINSYLYFDLNSLYRLYYKARPQLSPIKHSGAFQDVMTPQARRHVENMGSLLED